MMWQEMEKDNMRDHMRPMHNQADDKIYESEQRENTKRHRYLGSECIMFPWTSLYIAVEEADQGGDAQKHNNKGIK